MIVITNEYKRGFVHMLVWSLTCSLIVSLSILAYYSISFEQIEAVVKSVFSYIPPYISQYFEPDDLNIIQRYDYFIAYIYQPILIISCIYAARLGLSAISKEEKKGTIHFLYSFPVSRFHLVAQKIIGTLLLFLTYCLIIAGITFGLSVLAVPQINIMDLLFLISLLICSIFLAGFVYCLVGFLISSKPKTLRSPTLTSLFIVVVSMAMGILSKNFDSLEMVGYISPYNYSAPLEVINSGMSLIHYIMAIGISLMSLGFTFIFYRKRKLMPSKI